jgi:hypothetical protein
MRGSLWSRICQRGQGRGPFRDGNYFDVKLAPMPTWGFPNKIVRDLMCHYSTAPTMDNLSPTDNTKQTRNRYWISDYFFLRLFQAIGTTP